MQRTGLLAITNGWYRYAHPQHCRSCSGWNSCTGVRGLAGDGAEVPLAVACPGEEGDCPALECGDYACMGAMLSCPDDRRCPVPGGAELHSRECTLSS